MGKSVDVFSAKEQWCAETVQIPVDSGTCLCSVLSLVRCSRFAWQDKSGNINASELRNVLCKTELKPLSAICSPCMLRFFSVANWWDPRQALGYQPMRVVISEVLKEAWLALSACPAFSKMKIWEIVYIYILPVRYPELLFRMTSVLTHLLSFCRLVDFIQTFTSLFWSRWISNLMLSWTLRTGPTREDVTLPETNSTWNTGKMSFLFGKASWQVLSWFWECIDKHVPSCTWLQEFFHFMLVFKQRDGFSQEETALGLHMPFLGGRSEFKKRNRSGELLPLLAWKVIPKGCIKYAHPHWFILLSFSGATKCHELRSWMSTEKSFKSLIAICQQLSHVSMWILESGLKQLKSQAARSDNINVHELGDMLRYLGFSVGAIGVGCMRVLFEILSCLWSFPCKEESVWPCVKCRS